MLSADIAAIKREGSRERGCVCVSKQRMVFRKPEASRHPTATPDMEVMLSHYTRDRRVVISQTRRTRRVQIQEVSITTT